MCIHSVVSVICMHGRYSCCAHRHLDLLIENRGYVTTVLVCLCLRLIMW